MQPTEDKKLKWSAAPLLSIGDEQYDEFVSAKKKKSALWRLMKELDINPIWYDIVDNMDEIKICDG